MPHQILNVPAHGMLEAYDRLLAEKGFQADAAQRTAALKLQDLYTRLLCFKAARRTALRKMISRAKPPRGLYFWGGVGRGKSFLMDCFFAAVPYRRKRRTHFHAFMQEIHRELERLKGRPDPLVDVGERIARETRLLCFDEFHVSDIADAMILGRLLEVLFEQGVILVMTSNYPPDNLYPNGLQRMNFLPTIALIKKQLDVIEVDAGVDYRLRALERVATYLQPADAAAEARLADYFVTVAGQGGEVDGEIEVLDRPVPFHRRKEGSIWFRFHDLCEGHRSQNDYLEIARAYHTLVLSGVPRLEAKDASAARRFTWLVDVLYDHRVKLIMSADTEPEDIYREGPQSGEFFRTASRLIEMRSKEYLALPHQTDIGH